jgi:surface antigen
LALSGAARYSSSGIAEVLPMRAVALAALLLLPGLAAAQTLSDAAARLRDDTYLRAWTTPLGRPLDWRDAESGDHGRIVPLREYKKDDAPCRDMAETLTIQGEVRQGAATGCRAPDRHWQVVTATPAEVPADLPPYQPPADISADPPKPAPAPSVILRIRPPGGRSTAAPEIYLSVPPPPAPGGN